MPFDPRLPAPRLAAILPLVLALHAGAAPPLLATSEDATALAGARDPLLRSLEAEERRADAERRAERALPNPEAEGSFKRARGRESGRWEIAVKGDVGALLAAPWTYGAADARAKAARARTERARAERRFAVEEAWLRAVAAEALRALEAEAASTRSAEAELARRMRAAGTLNALDLAEAEAAEAEARVALRRAGREAEAARAALAGALGTDEWTLPEALPEPQGDDPPFAAWEEVASRSSPWLLAERAGADAARRDLTRARLASLPGLRAGVEFEGGDGPVAAGPVVALEIPLFDPGFGKRAQARASVDVAERRLEAQALDVRARLAALHAELVEARAAHAAWRDTVLPLRAQASAEALRHYNFMHVGADRLLAARREELAARRAATESLRDYWIARAALRRLAGADPGEGRAALLPAAEDGPEADPRERPAPQPKAPGTERHHHHH